MKILHTSDWHLGHTLYNLDRSEEQAAMLEQMVNLVAEQQPDVFLLCGDIYHTPQPSAAVQTMLVNTLLQLHEVQPQMVIVATAGNHDSGSKHEIFRTPWRVMNVHTIGSLDKEHPDEHIIEVPDTGFIIALPYCNERSIPEGFFQQLLDKVGERNTDNLPVVMMAHTTLRGCDFSGHDYANEYVVGGIDTLDLEKMGEGYDYLALGHIHREQFVHSGKHNVRYSGTPLPISFDESFSHSVTLVEIGKHGDAPVVTTLEIRNPHPLVTLPTRGFAPWEEAKRLLGDYPDDIPAYIRLNVEVDDFLPAEAYAEALGLTGNKQCKFCCINTKRKETKQSDTKALTIQEFQSEEPSAIVKRYFEDSGFTFDDELDSLFKEVMEMVHDEARR